MRTADSCRDPDVLPPYAKLKKAIAMKVIEEREGFVSVWAGDIAADELAEYRSERDT